MKKAYKVSYILSGITERTDIFTDMTDNSTESAIKAIREKFNGAWGFDPESIEVKETVSGHFERKADPRWPFGSFRFFVAD